LQKIVKLIGAEMNIDLEHIRNHFKKDRFATGIGVVIDSVTEDCVVCSMELNEKHRNSVDGVHGGAIFTLADLTFGVHCNLNWVSNGDVGVTLGQSCSISFLKGSKGKRLIARSTCISKGRSMSVYRVCVEDDLGMPIAEMLANGFTTNKG
jgi:acyl-CoA thioesterase